MVVDREFQKISLVLASVLRARHRRAPPTRAKRARRRSSWDLRGSSWRKRPPSGLRGEVQRIDAEVSHETARLSRGPALSSARARRRSIASACSAPEHPLLITAPKEPLLFAGLPNAAIGLVGVWHSSAAGRRATSTGCRVSSTNWRRARSMSSLHSAILRRLLANRRRHSRVGGGSRSG